MHFSTLTFIIILSLNNTLFSQYPNVEIGGPINQYEPEEVSIVLNPINTNEILVGANHDNYYYSIDSGLTWQHDIISSSFGVAADPCVLVDNTGSYYYFHLVPDLSRVVCQKSTTIGGSWSNGTFTGLNGTKDNDKEWAAINMINNYIYLTWAQFDEHGSTSSLDSSEIQLSRSTDGGITWSIPVKISDRNGNAMGGNYSAHAPMPAIGPGNQVYVTWMSPLGLMFDKSTDDGQTWLENDINITGSHINWLLFNINGIQRAPGFPVINCDLSSGDHNGNIYICWSDQRSGYNDTDVWLVKSTDGGNSWSIPIRVNDDSPGKHQFFPWMTIDQFTGYLYFVFYDRRNYSDNNTDVYMAISQDGGETFNNFRISGAPFTPTSYDFIGDYIGVSAVNNIVRPVWTRVDNHQLSIRTAIINNPVSIKDKLTSTVPSDFVLFQNYPNPFNPVSTIKYGLPVKSMVQLFVFNILGEKIAELTNELKDAGYYEMKWEANSLPSGIYFCSIAAKNEDQSKSFRSIKKMILLK